MTFIPPGKTGTECEAAWTVAAIIGGRPQRRDGDGAPDQTHDFDIHVVSDDVIALEVTSSVFGEVAAFWRSLAETTFGIDELRLCWSISVTHPHLGPNTPQVKDLRKYLVAQLLTIEAHLSDGVVDVMWEPEAFVGTEAAGAIVRLRQLGVNTANPLQVFNSERAQVGVGTGGFHRHLSMKQVIENKIADNDKKLAKAQATQRHLFVWITDTDIGNSVAMALDQLPQDEPDTFGCSDVIWVGLWSPGYRAESWAQ